MKKLKFVTSLSLLFIASLGFTQVKFGLRNDIGVTPSSGFYQADVTNKFLLKAEKTLNVKSSVYGGIGLQMITKSPLMLSNDNGYLASIYNEYYEESSGLLIRQSDARYLSFDVGYKYSFGLFFHWYCGVEIMTKVKEQTYFLDYDFSVDPSGESVQPISVGNKTSHLSGLDFGVSTHFAIGRRVKYLYGIRMTNLAGRKVFEDADSQLFNRAFLKSTFIMETGLSVELFVKKFKV